MNCVVAGISYFVYGYQIEPVILCILYCFLSSNVSDRILRSGKAAIKFEIVTQQPDEISQELIHRLGHSATRVEGKGDVLGSCHLHSPVRDQQGATGWNLRTSFTASPGTFAYLSQVKEVVGNFKHINKNGQAGEPSA